MKIRARVMTIVFVLIVATIAIVNAVMPKKDFSENENRYLASFPHFSLERVVSGAYMEDWNSWLADHFPFRDFFVGAKTETETALGKMEFLLRRTAI